jgi:hypothetical protein
LASAYLLSAAPASRRDPKAYLDLEQMRDSAGADRFGVHEVVDDPGEADVILFVETSGAAGYYFERVRRHPVYRAFRSRSYLFCSTDRVVPLLPGIYASIEARQYRPAWTRSGHYLGVKERGPLRYKPDRSPSWLYSFVGSATTNRFRARIMDLQHPEALIIDIDSEPPADDPLKRFADSIHDSSFVLCPRGGGTSTFRLFEAMMLGRVPVIVSDQWVPPKGPDWPSFSLRVREGDLASVPELLESHTVHARAMGEAARAVWLDWFSEPVSFHRTIEWCLELAFEAPSRTGLERYRPWLQMLRPYHAARAVAKRLGHGASWGPSAPAP